MATPYDPIREIERLFNTSARATGSMAMPMDLYRSGDTFTARIDLPGVDPSTIDVDVEDRTLTIRAQRRTEPEGQVQWLSHERQSGTFARQLTLGYGVALDRIQADYADGVLTLAIPVAEEAKPRKISVNHRQGSQTVSSEVTSGSGS